jgi:hypothetical protein
VRTALRGIVVVESGKWEMAVKREGVMEEDGEEENEEKEL